MSSHWLKRANERLVVEEGNMQKPIQSSHKFHIFHLTLLLSGVKKWDGKEENELFHFFFVETQALLAFTHTHKVEVSAGK